MITKSISEGFKFAISVKRVIPYLILNLIAFYILIQFFGSLISTIMTGMGFFKLLLSMGIYIPAFIVISLIQLWINGAIIDQAKYYPRKRSLTKSFEYSTSRYLSMFCAFILYGILTMIVSSARFIGFLLSIVVSLVFFYLFQAIIVDKKKCIDAFKKSYKTFIRFPLETFVTWILIMIIGFIIVGVFSLPLIFYVIGSAIDVFQAIPYENMTVPRDFMKTLIPRISSAIYSPYFIPYLFVLCVGLAFVMTFRVGTQTRLYINTRKTEV